MNNIHFLLLLFFSLLSFTTWFSCISFSLLLSSSRVTSAFLSSSFPLFSSFFSSHGWPFPLSISPQLLFPSIHDCGLRLCETTAFPCGTFAILSSPHLAIIVVISLIAFVSLIYDAALPIQVVAPLYPLSS